uniref:Beta-1,4-glucuronyltransferase 1-like n=1 Tax=Hirondellea gigas TaxID=1518452 RepID=A0A6A7G596_9CRUS
MMNEEVITKTGYRQWWSVMGPNRFMLMWLFVLVNVLLVTYVCLNSFGSSPIVGPQIKSSWLQQQPLVKHDSANISNDAHISTTEVPKQNPIESLKSIASTHIEYLKTMLYNASNKETGKSELTKENDNEDQKIVRDDLADDPHPHELQQETQENTTVTEQPAFSAMSTVGPDPPLDSLEKKMYPDLKGCHRNPQLYDQSQHGQYWVLENYILAAKSFSCSKSITYTTHADYTYLANLVPLTARWRGPISLGIYAPGEDFENALSTIMYLRECSRSKNIKNFVTFHFIYHTDHMPKQIPSQYMLWNRETNCSMDLHTWTNVTTYRRRKEIMYPLNIVRNVARRAATTYFVCASDIELYPSVNFIPEFFKMLKKPDISNTTVPKVFAFAVFEVNKTESPPETKPELLKLLAKNAAVSYHKYVCNFCHKIPHYKDWVKAPVNPGISILAAGKRLGAFKKWAPFYVGTNKEPIYDERLSWEGKSDKVTQMFILCVRDYEFLIMDNAFLVHRPGIKYPHWDPYTYKNMIPQHRLIWKHIRPEYKVLFGSRTGCVI